MRNDRRIARGNSVYQLSRHPLVYGITEFLDCLADAIDPVAKRHVHWTPLATATAAGLMALGHHVTLRAAFGDGATGAECLTKVKAEPSGARATTPSSSS